MKFVRATRRIDSISRISPALTSGATPGVHLVSLPREVTLCLPRISQLPSQIQIHRDRAFKVQNGFCFYCQQPMAPAQTVGAINRCTAEHLRARVDKGTNQQKNIVAACWLCNHDRHAGRSNSPTPAEWATYVRYQVHARKWPTVGLVSRIDFARNRRGTDSPRQGRDVPFPAILGKCPAANQSHARPH